VWGEKLIMGVSMMGIIRTTFVISENRIIEKVITEVDTSNHTSQIIN
jgi:peroxiredoxin Q/BCP